MFKIISIKSRKVSLKDRFDQRFFDIEEISETTTFIYAKGAHKPDVSVYHYDYKSQDWFFSNKLKWDLYEACKRLLTS